MARKAFVHDAVVAMQSGGSPNAPGAAITLALFGSCGDTLGPHYVSNTPADETVTLRVLFATEPVNEQHFRTLIGEALATGRLGRLQGPDSLVATWQLRSAAPGRFASTRMTMRPILLRAEPLDPIRSEVVTGGSHLLDKSKLLSSTRRAHGLLGHGLALARRRGEELTQIRLRDW